MSHNLNFILFQITDYFEYSAEVKTRLFKNGVDISDTEICEEITTLDPGSRNGSDPFMECTFTESGDYVVEVYSEIDYAEQSVVLGIPNAYYPDEDSGVLPDQSYDLIISLPRHDTNAGAIDLNNTLLTMSTGASAGQTAIIESYDSTRQEFLLRSGETIVENLINKEEFEVVVPTSEAYETPPEQIIDQYSLTATAEPTSEIVIDVNAIPTRTFDASNVFNEESNYGQNEIAQVETATKQTLIVIDGNPAPTNNGKSGLHR